MINVQSYLPYRLAKKSIVLVGLMGSGKTTVGRKLASSLEIPFVDADHEIEKAAGCSIEEYFASYGEPAFREGEKRVIKRLLNGNSKVIATGGGAYMSESIREMIAETSISIWLRADVEILTKRTRRRNNRPLLKGKDPKAILQNLVDTRYSTYAKADIVVDTGPESIEITTRTILKALDKFLPQVTDI